ncbi:MAG: isochorismatase family cysteine hydrolase [Chloroflexota bacterium]
MKLEELLEKMAFTHSPLKITPQNTALVLIDMQKLALSDYLVHNAVEIGVDEGEARAAVKDMDLRFEKAVANASKILQACRQKKIRPIHIRIESYSADAADVGRVHKQIGFFVPPGSEWGEFIEATKPLPGEIVLPKTNSSAFTGTMLNQVLRNLGLEEVIIVGFYTDQCITTAARDSADLGYGTLVVEDAVMAVTLENHESAIKHIKNVYVRCCNTSELLEKINNL